MTAGLVACLATQAWAGVTVSLTAPANNSVFQAGEAGVDITLSATASATQGYTVGKVEFFLGTTLIGTDTSAPYSIVWNSVPVGSYSLTAKATAIKKNSSDQTATSVPVNITVNASVAQLHFIHVDHLNTPRLVANQQGQTVWRWDQQEPFGNNPADRNPSGLGTFDLPLRLPGQYYEKETNLHYNYFRDYDPSIGRYVESDPIGLKAGLNTYAYVRNIPLRFVDLLGLFTGAVHEELTRNVARRSCPKLVNSLPAVVSNVDFIPGSQDPSNSYMHAMCSPGMSISQGMTITEDYIEQQLSMCSVLGLGKALHAGQDKHSPSHRACQPWPGRQNMTIAELMTHANADTGRLGGVSDAAIESELIINRFKARCPCLCE